MTYATAGDGTVTTFNPATKLPHTPAYLARTRPVLARVVADLEHCRARARSRKRSVAALMAERGHSRDSRWNTEESARALLASLAEVSQ
jgi:hypothetical protein